MQNQKQYRIIRPKEACLILGVSLPTLWRYSKEPDFPRKVVLGRRVTGYRSDELEAFIEKNKEP